MYPVSVLSSRVEFRGSAGGNPWHKCSDDVTRMYESLSEGDVPTSFSSGDSFTRRLVFARADGTAYTPKQLQSLRDQIVEMSSASKIVATVGDDTGSAVYIRNSTGAELLLTPGAAGSCGDSTGATGTHSVSAMYEWHSSREGSAVNGLAENMTGVAEAVTVDGLPRDFLLPSAVRIVVPATGGGA